MTNSRKWIGWLVAQAYALAGVRWRALRRYDRSGTVLSIVTHCPSVSALDAVLAYFVGEGFVFLSADEFLAMKAGALPWRKRVAWLTFDDGWGGFERNLLPVLEKHRVPVSLFIAPQETARGQVWTNALLPDITDWAPFFPLSADERYRCVDRLCDGKIRLRALADAAELARLARHPLVTLENHTLTHLSCAKRPSAEVMDEVRRTQKILTEWTGRAPRLVAYPFGHYTSETNRLLREEGLVPVTIDPGVMTLDVFGGKRNMFYDETTTAENIGRVLGAWPKVKPMNERLK